MIYIVYVILLLSLISTIVSLILDIRIVLKGYGKSGIMPMAFTLAFVAFTLVIIQKKSFDWSIEVKILTFLMLIQIFFILLIIMRSYIIR